MSSASTKREKNESRTAWTDTLAATRTASAPETALNQMATENLAWLSTPGRDARDNKYLQPYLQLYQQAEEKAQKERMGTGALQLGAPGSEQYTNALRTMAADQRARDYATNLGQTYGKLFEGAVNAAGNAANLSNQRALGALGSTTSIYQTNLNRPSGLAQIGSALAAGAGSAAAASDIRLKSEIKVSPYGLHEVMQLQPVWYIIDGHEQVGFIAQDVEQFMPEFVTEIHNGYKGLNYGNMVAVLAKAIQELAFEVAAVKQIKKKGRIRKLLSSCLAWLSRVI